MAIPTKQYSKEEKDQMLQRAYGDWSSASPAKRKLMSEMLYKPLGFGSAGKLAQFFAGQDEPTISSARGKPFVPIRPKLAKEFIETQKEIAPLGGSDRRRAAELQMEGLADLAQGVKKTPLDAAMEGFKLLQAAAPVPSVPGVVKGRTVKSRLTRAAKRRIRKKLYRQMTPEQKAKRKERSDKLATERNIREDLKKASLDLDPVSETFVETPFGAKVLQEVRKYDRELTVLPPIKPVEVAKLFYESYAKLPNQAAANLMANKMNEVRPKNNKINAKDLMSDIEVVITDFPSSRKYDVGFFNATQNTVYINRKYPLEMKIAAILHELTHAYDRTGMLKEGRRGDNLFNRITKATGDILEGRVANPQNLKAREDFLKSYGYDPFVSVRENVLSADPVAKPSVVRKVFKRERPQSTSRRLSRTRKAYLSEQKEVGPNLWSLLNRFSASRLGLEVMVPEQAAQFAKMVNNTPGLKKALFRLMDRGRMGSSQPEINQNIIDRLQYDKAFQKEFIQWVQNNATSEDLTEEEQGV